MKYIALQAFKVLLREKIIFNIFGITVLFLFFGFLASQLVYGHQDRVMLDLGLMLNALSIFAVAIGIGARFLRQEIENKTIYLLLTRPISRVSFFLGRFFGMSAFVIVNFSILTMVLWISVRLMDGKLSMAFFQSSVLTSLEALILLSISLLLSFWLRPTLVFMANIALIFLGHNHQMMNALQANAETKSLLFEVLGKLTPNFSLFLMSDRVYYEEALDHVGFATSLLYGFVWLLFFLLIGNTVFSRKNL